MLLIELLLADAREVIRPWQPPDRLPLRLIRELTRANALFAVVCTSLKAIGHGCWKLLFLGFRPKQTYIYPAYPDRRVCFAQGPGHLHFYLEPAPLASALGPPRRLRPRTVAARRT